MQPTLACLRVYQGSIGMPGYSAVVVGADPESIRSGPFWSGQPASERPFATAACRLA